MLRGYVRTRVLRTTSSSELVAATAPDGAPVVLKIAAGRFAERLAAMQVIDPEARLHLVEGGGHWVQYESADAVNALLIAEKDAD